MSNTDTNTHIGRYPTDITADEKLPAVRIERCFDATPEQVQRAHTDPDLIKRWMGPHGMTMTIDTWDCRTGGEYRWCHADDNGEYWFRGCFHEVGPDRIVQTFTFEGYPDGVCLEWLHLTDLGDGRTKLETLSMFDSFEARDQMLASGMETGVLEGYEKLDDVLDSDDSEGAS